jgi:hypothetical protein
MKNFDAIRTVVVWCLLLVMAFYVGREYERKAIINALAARGVVWQSDSDTMAICDVVVGAPHTICTPELAAKQQQEREKRLK